jgi:hypothetical protein
MVLHSGHVPHGREAPIGRGEQLRDVIAVAGVHRAAEQNRDLDRALAELDRSTQKLSEPRQALPDLGRERTRLVNEQRDHFVASVPSAELDRRPVPSRAATLAFVRCCLEPAGELL